MQRLDLSPILSPGRSSHREPNQELRFRLAADLMQRSARVKKCILLAGWNFPKLDSINVIVKSEYRVADYAPQLLFLTALVYSGCLIPGTMALEIAATIVFIVVTSFICAKCIKQMGAQDRVSSGRLLFFGLSIPSGLVIPATLFGKSAEFFWVIDSIKWHVPRSEELALMLRGLAPLQLNWSLQSEAFLTHLWVGLLFAVFGSHPWVSVVALGLIKFATAAILVQASRRLFRSDDFKSVFVIYLVAPIVLFHTTTYYKEAVVHLLVAATIWIGLAAFEKLTIKRALALVLVFAGLLCERYYILVPLAPLLLALFVSSLESKRILVSLVLALGAYFVFVTHPYIRFNLDMVVEQLHHLRKVHSEYADVNYRYNYEIPYAIAVVKTLLTPIWTPGKIEMFRNFSALLTWGSFIHQAIVFAYLAGVYRAYRTWGATHLAIQIPFIIFLLLVAYVSPWAGRVRDSFSPLFALYACYYLKRYFVSDARRATAWAKGLSARLIN